jgi:hypothetical protein
MLLEYAFEGEAESNKSWSDRDHRQWTPTLQEQMSDVGTSVGDGDQRTSLSMSFTTLATGPADARRTTAAVNTTLC